MCNLSGNDLYDREVKVGKVLSGPSVSRSYRVSRVKTGGTKRSKEKGRANLTINRRRGVVTGVSRHQGSRVYGVGRPY